MIMRPNSDTSAHRGGTWVNIRTSVYIVTSLVHRTMAALRLKWYATLAIAIVLSIWFGSTFYSKSRNFLDPSRSTVHSESSPTILPQPIWLIATSTPAHSLQRRSIIRATWQDLYRNDTLITTRFILANPEKDGLRSSLMKMQLMET